MNEEIAGSSELGRSLHAGSPPQPPLDKIMIAIHGIGSQPRSDTVRSVARRFGSRVVPPIPVMPLGHFHIEKTGEVRVSRLDLPPDFSDPLARIGFAEVFWADIPRKVEKEQDTLEETKAWGGTVVSRVQAAYHDNVGKKGKLTAEDFRLVEGALDEVLETIQVLENLCSLASLAGVFKFDLAQLLRDFLGDVQLVAEFRYYRQKIVFRFHHAMEQILERFKAEYPGRKPEFYIVAHSEGTVISFLGLLEALSGNRVKDPEASRVSEGSLDWIRYVRGFMTIGSPIDKHLVLWPKMWEGLQISSENRNGTVVFHGVDGKPRLTLEGPIRWRNYYDFGDPIGFQLDTAELWLKQQNCSAFEFSTDKHDFGFSRYLLPGKAHNDYWDDSEVFGHFIDDVVLPVKPERPPPPSSRLRAIISTSIPYAISLLCHAGAVFLLFKAVTAYTPTKYSAGEAAISIGILTVLLASITVAARLPRLVKPGAMKWLVAAFAAISIGAASYATLMPVKARANIGVIFTHLTGSVHDTVQVPGSIGSAATIGVLILAVLVAFSGWVLPRTPRFGRRTLVISGALGVVLIVAARFWEAEDVPVWPVLLAGGAYLYLWWLGILLFDLAFMWHRYIRNSVAIVNLWYWKHCKQDPPDNQGDGPRKGERRTTPPIHGLQSPQA